MKKLITIALTLALLVGPAPIQAHEGGPTAEDLAVRDQLIANQEALLNVYRCMFHIDTEVVPGGCGTSATTTIPTGIYAYDHYWGQADYFGDRSYFVDIRNVPDDVYACKVHLLKNGRRTGKWGIEVVSNGRAVVEVHDADSVDWDQWETEC